MPGSSTKLTADKIGYIKSVAVSGAKILCMDPDLSKLTVDELNLLHLCKHEILAAIHRLYTKMDIATADPILREYFKKVVDEAKPGNPLSGS